MPFIFHSVKQSIFHKKPLQLTEDQQYKIKQIQSKIAKQPHQYKISVEICKQHPFRKLYTNQTEDQSHNEDTKSSSIKKKIHEYIVKFNKQKNMLQKVKKNCLNNSSENIINGLEGQIVKCFPEIKSNLQEKVNKLPQKQIVNLSKSSDQNGFTIKTKNTQNNDDNCDNQSEINQTQTPGPGSYDAKYPTRQKATVIYTQKRTIPLIPKKSFHEVLGERFKHKEEQQNDIEFTCSYKNQNSSTFKPKTIGGLKKNSELLSKLFIKKDKQMISDLQTACESRHVQRANCKNYDYDYDNDDQYEISRQKSPSPCSYDPKKDFKKTLNNKKNIFITTASKMDYSYVKKDTHLIQSFGNQYIQRRLFGQNQINKSDQIKQGKSSFRYPFSSTVPRELHFDTQNFCQQELYYSPKNNFTDMKTVNNLSKLRFGSSLQRFQWVKQSQYDPYKYCEAKTKYLSKKIKNIASLKYRQKREIFKDNQDENRIPPNMYNPANHTIFQKTQDILNKNLRTQKYKSELNLMKEKKRSLQQPLRHIKINQNNKENCQQNQKKLLNPDKYKEYLIEQKVLEKQNIAFGQNRDSTLKRGIDAVESMDLCYDVEPTWKIGSFNRHYGYEIFEG